MAFDLGPYALAIFDKDGTLIDFNWMWGQWLEELGRRLEAATGAPLAPGLYRLMDYDAAAGRVIAGGRLAVMPMAELYVDTERYLRDQGLGPDRIRRVLPDAWHYPDPVALARPLADLPGLFSGLRERGLKVAVVTSDDRAGSRTTLAALGVTERLDALICADDGIPLKPRPDMVLEACRRTGVPPARTLAVGDAVVDLLMARAAGALAVGVLSGLATADQLRPYADVLLSNITDLL